LHRMKYGAVRDVHERDAGLGISSRAHPAFDGDRLVFRRLPGEDFANAELLLFHGRNLPSRSSVSSEVCQLPNRSARNAGAAICPPRALKVS
jgi:hypothetical protein